MRDRPTLSQDSNQGVKYLCADQGLKEPSAVVAGLQPGRQAPQLATLVSKGIETLAWWPKVRRRARGQGIRQAELPPGMKARGRI